MTGELLRTVDIVISWLAVLLGVGFSVIPRAPLRCRQIAVLLSIGLALRYILWRAVFTLNQATVLEAVLSYTLLLAEVYGLSYLLVFYVQCWSRPDRATSPPVPERTPSVDVFITVCSEPIEILFRTALCCTRLDYPSKRVYILDDDGRQEVRELAARLGCTYLHRPNRLGAKAGNLNYGLAHSSGDLVACFDVDHVPVNSFLRETVGYFRDPKVALVQTPHTFINPDPFQRNLLLSRHIVNEQDLFFHIAMPGRDRWNAAFFCGSAAVLRRSALVEVGGFRTETVTEDLHTSVHLHSRGYRSIYVDRPLSRGLAPESFAGYLSQRLRWARGAVQGLRLDNPLLLPGLTWRQRVLYFFAVYYFLFPLPRLIYTVAPLWFLLLGLKPLVADIPDLVNYFIPQFLLAVVVFDAFAAGHRSSFVSNAYELALSGWQLPVIVHAFFFPRRGQFTVTPKGETRMVGRFRWVLALPSLVLGSLLVCGILWGLVPLIFGQWLSSYTVVNLLWAAFHAITCAWAIAVAYERPQRREAHRVLVSLPAHLEAGGDAIAATITELSETGSLVKTPQVPIPDLVELTLEVPLHGTRTVPARVVGREILGSHELKVRLAFDFPSLPHREAVILAMYAHPEFVAGVSRQGMGRNLLTFLCAPLRVFLLERAFLRRHPRFIKHWPCVLTWDEGELSGLTRDVSEAGVRAVFRRRLRTYPPGIQLQLKVNGGEITVPASIRYWRKSLRGWTAGIAIEKYLPQDLDRVREELYGLARPSPEVASV